ncbi:MAG: acyl-CoA thioesterase [Crocinitomicaceae bacterium]|nr:acyl-CoA thioesterase [Crocinitomicaceae bacterium]MCF8444814.1 acyl-CoA thioesterase [Crocinitomicaceae bacterium]
MISPATIQVRFADLDVMGHVNNSVYLSYFEMTRVHYFKELVGANWDWRKEGVLLVRNEIDYVKPILLNDVPQIHMTLEKIGEKSISLLYEIKINEEVYTKGRSVLVCFNADEGKTIPVPVAMAEALRRLV